MESCWQLAPDERPSFNEIVARLSTLQSSAELQEQIHTIDTKRHSGDLEPLCSPSRSVLATYVNFPGSWASQEDSTSAPASVAASGLSPFHDPPKVVLPSRDKDASPPVSLPLVSLHNKSSEDEYDYVDRGKGKLFKAMAGKKAGKEEEYENSDLLPCSVNLSKAAALSGSLPDRDTSFYYNLPKGYLQAVESTRSKSSSDLPGLHATEEGSGKDHDTSDDSESDLSSWLRTSRDHNTYLKVMQTTGALTSAAGDCAKLSNDMAETGPAISMAEFK